MSHVIIVCVATGLVVVLMFGSLLWTRPSLAIVLAVPLLLANDLISMLLGEGATAVAFGSIKDLGLLLLLAVALHRRRSSLYGSWVRPILVLLGIALLGVLSSPSLAQGFYGLRNGYMPLLWVLVCAALVGPTAIRRVFAMVVWSGQLAAAVAVWSNLRALSWLFQMGVLPPGPGEPYPASYFSSGSRVPRAFSPFVGPNELALGMIVVVGVVAADSRRGLASRTALLVLPVAAILLTRSRSGLLGLVLLFAFLVIRHVDRAGGHSRFALTLIFSALLGALIAIYVLRPDAPIQADLSIQGHTASLKETLDRIIDHPFGYGTGSVGPRAARFTDAPILTESYVLLVALEAGVVACLTYLLVLRHFVATLSSRVQDDRVAAGLAVLVGSLISQMVLPAMQSTAVASLVWITVGTSLAAVRHSQARGQVAAVSDGAEHPGRAGSRHQELRGWRQ